MKVWSKNCPKCEITQTYSSWDSFRLAKRKNTNCSKCGINNRTKYIVRSWTRICPSCNVGIIYNIYGNWWRANKLNKKCNVCVKKVTKQTEFKIGHNFRLSKESLIKLSQSVKKAMHQPDIRKRHINALHRSKWIRVKTDHGQLEMLNKWNRIGFHFEPNFQIHTDSDLFYIDGYDPINNVVFEYDSKYHMKPYQKTKDNIRQEKIISILNPKKFWRYNSINKQFVNVLEETIR